MRHNFAIFLSLFVGLLSWSCGEFTGPTQRDIPGLYDMETFGGSPLPHALTDSISVVSSTMILSADGTYAETVIYSARNNPEYYVMYRGTYSYSFNQVTVRLDNGGGFLLEVADKRTLTENDANGVIVYAKQ